MPHCRFCKAELETNRELVDHIAKEHCDFDKPPVLPVRKPEKTEPNPWHGLINNPGPRKYR
jgi:hypothetical protein